MVKIIKKLNIMGKLNHSTLPPHTLGARETALEQKLPLFNNERGLALKTGFTLIEVLVSMLIMSFFFLASTKVLTMKQKDEFQKNPHGYYECYMNGFEVWSHRKDEKQTGEPKKTDKCFMEPPKGVSFVNIHYIKKTAADKGIYYNNQEPIFNEAFEIPSPSAFLPTLSDVGIYTDYEGLTEEEQKAKWAQDINSFMVYLQMVHPDSEVYKKWLGVDTPPEAIFIAW